mgnify:CR=1 FL=1
MSGDAATEFAPPADLLQLQRLIAARPPSESLLPDGRQAAREPRPPASPHPAGETAVQRFEAPIHQAAERVGLTTNDEGGGEGGATGDVLTNEEASAVYFGNWMRDVNQVFVPFVKGIVQNDDLLFSLVDYIAVTKFGRQLTPEQFGYYIPAEHLDNPAGLVSKDDLLPQQPNIPTGNASGKAPPRPEKFVTPQEPVSPDSTVRGAPLFAVDQSGVIAYLRRSNLHIERRLELAAQLGRTPEGLLHFGAALHALEDLYSHSNWVEIAVNRVLSDQPDLLPELKGPERQVFNFSQTIALPETDKAPRPVLLTGSFTSADTLISITSEVVNFLNKPLPKPKSNRETEVQQAFVRKSLHATQSQLQNNPKLHAAIRQDIERELPSWTPGRHAIAESVASAPLEQIYDLNTLLPKWIPDKVKDPTTRRVRKTLHDTLSERGLKPLAGRIQAEALGARIADTSLLNVLTDSERQAEGNFSKTDQRLMQEVARLGGSSVDEQKRNKTAAGKRRAEALQSTPLPIVAGPSHSQVAKDHANSPFFGLAFKLAAAAVRSMREKMLAAWAERAGARTKPIDFSYDSFPTDKDEKELYHAGRAERGEAESKSRARGKRIVAQGNDAPQPYDLAAMRADSASQIRQVSAGLRALAHAPEGLAAALQVTNQWIMRLKSLAGVGKSYELERAQAELVEAAAASRSAGGKLRAAVSFDELAAQFDAAAGVVEQAVAHSEREAANTKLSALRNETLKSLVATASVKDTLAASILVILDKQIAATAVSYSGRQRRVLAGQEAVAGHHGPATLAVRTVALPDIRDRSPAVRALLEESRKLFNHPYESTWWVGIVTNHIRANPKQILTDVQARNSGVPFYTRPGEPDHDED